MSDGLVAHPKLSQVLRLQREPLVDGRQAGFDESSLEVKPPHGSNSLRPRPLSRARSNPKPEGSRPVDLVWRMPGERGDGLRTWLIGRDPLQQFAKFAPAEVRGR